MYTDNQKLILESCLVLNENILKRTGAELKSAVTGKYKENYEKLAQEYINAKNYKQMRKLACRAYHTSEHEGPLTPKDRSDLRQIVNNLIKTIKKEYPKYNFDDDYKYFVRYRELTVLSNLD